MAYKYKVFYEGCLERYKKDVTQFLQHFTQYFEFFQYNEKYRGPKARCLWWFVDMDKRFKKSDVESIIRFTEIYIHVPVVIIYTDLLASTVKVEDLDMENEMQEISMYLENTTFDSDIGVVTIKEEKDFERLRAVTKHLSYHFTISTKWFARERNPQYDPVTDCEVKFYHDACHSFNGNNLWEDISTVLRDAKRLILIMGWSLDYKMRLHRYDGDNETVGEILQRKAEEGVMVCLFLWHDFADFMKTANIETRKYFKERGGKVSVRLRMRRTSLRQYSHHQKLILCDEYNGLTAFVGGFDITRGRFDTPEHTLFSTLDTIHSDDFYNSATNHKRGDNNDVPRLPWHDVDCKVKGDIVWDMLNHFRGHWLLDYRYYKMSKKRMNKKIYQLISDLYPGNFEQVSRARGEWLVQFFSSVTKAQLFKRRLSVDDGIHLAYIQAINNADKFIYIENQFFVGGSYLWLDETDYVKIHNAPNSVPVLLADRIIRKAREREPFKVYILIPQFPDGDPDTVQVTAVLYFQFKTIEMMYHRITTAFKALKIDGQVEDYLIFGCLGKVEWCEAKKRFERYQIYIHSKLMIVDDEYLIMGSANLNSRSLSGKRDSEICIGCSEAYLKTGKIRAFRECLWKEHFGVSDQDKNFHSELEETSVVFDPENEPNDQQVFDKFKAFSVMNTHLFNSSRIMLNQGRSHLMKLPIKENYSTGRLEALGVSEFENMSFSGKRPKVFYPFSLFT